MFRKLVNLLSTSGHAHQISIISPYITIRPVKAISRILPAHTEFIVVTDFNYESFINGSSSLGAFVFLAGMPCVHIYTVDKLHAKAYIWGSRALIGSANFTDRGLGFSPQSNIEVLTSVDRADDSIEELLQYIEEKKRLITQGEIQVMATRLSYEKARYRAMIRKRVHYILSCSDWVPSCSLRYLMQYLRDGSLYKVPPISRNKINEDAHSLETKFDIAFDPQDMGSILGRILEIPIVQLAVECRLRGDRYLFRCLKAKDVSTDQIDALENWSDYCISHISEEAGQHAYNALT